MKKCDERSWWPHLLPSPPTNPDYLQPGWDHPGRHHPSLDHRHPCHHHLGHQNPGQCHSVVINIRVTTSTLVVFITAIHNASFCHCLIFDDNCILLLQNVAKVALIIFNVTILFKHKHIAHLVELKAMGIWSNSLSCNLSSWNKKWDEDDGDDNADDRGEGEGCEAAKDGDFVSKSCERSRWVASPCLLQFPTLVLLKWEIEL